MMTMTVMIVLMIEMMTVVVLDMMTVVEYINGDYFYRTW